MDRREFFKTSALATAGVATLGVGISGCVNQDNSKSNYEYINPILSSKPGLPKIAPIKNVKMGFVGVGAQGSSHVRNFLNIEGVQIKAICDIIPEKAERMQKWVKQAGFESPTLYTKGELDFKRMIDNEELDLVFTATPWDWHVPIALYSMENNKHIAIEVPAAIKISECWQLVEYAEKYNKHCVMMENVNYGQRELMVLNMVRKGIFGELIHAECGYLHDLRNYKIGGDPEKNWRLQHSINRNGNVYPTHGLGPVANAMNINRGNKFEYLVSMSSKARGLNLFADEHLGKDHKLANLKFALGDVNVTLIKNYDGSTITLYHDTNLPRPYTRIDMIQGTKAISQGYPDRIHIEGMSPEHEWETFDKYQKEYEHQLWQNIDKFPKDARHGGMDFLEDYRLIKALQTGTPTDMDVYDAVALSVVAELTEISVANKSKAVDFPDFTRGYWKERNSLIIPGL